jgi:outer membrane beta-barrel protein
MSSERALASALWLWAAGALADPAPSPDVARYVVQQRPFPDLGVRELVLFPVVPQLNGRFTDHLGTQGAFVWHLQENFALQIVGGGNWLSGESAFNADLATRAQVAAQAASTLLWTWGLMGGVEVSPVYGKFAWFEGTLVHFSLVISGGAGAGGTRIQLKATTPRPDGTTSPASFGDTGVKFLGSLGAGFRLRLGEHVALRLEVRDVVYTARVEKVNGCGVSDLTALEARVVASLPLEGTPVASGCDLRPFLGRAPGGDTRTSDVALALQLVQGDRGVPTSDVLNNVGLYLGVSFLF